MNAPESPENRVEACYATRSLSTAHLLERLEHYPADGLGLLGILALAHANRPARLNPAYGSGPARKGCLGQRGLQGGQHDARLQKIPSEANSALLWPLLATSAPIVPFYDSGAGMAEARSRTA